MIERAKLDITLGQREHLLETLAYEYVLPSDFHACVKTAIKHNSTKNYSEDTITCLVEKPLSLAGSLSSLGAIREGDLSLFRGKLTEWLVCMEYNALKNKGNVVMTIVNPDPSSKADLLHILKTDYGYQCMAGPDVKCGDAYYVFGQWKKILSIRREIPMIDVDDVFTDEEALKKLYPRIWREYKQLKEMYPGKRPLPSVWSKQDIMRVTMDYIMYMGDDVTPSTIRVKPFPDNYTKKENCDRIKAKVRASSEETSLQAGWDVFCKKARELPNVSDDYLSTISREIQNHMLVTKQAAEAQLKAENAGKRLPSSGPEAQGWLRKMQAGANQFAANKGYSSFAKMAWKYTRKAAWEGLLIVGPDIVGALFQPRGKEKANSQVRYFQVDRSAQMETAKEITKEMAGAVTHASPKLHMVPGHSQTYHTKNGLVEVTKEAYRRGGKE